MENLTDLFNWYIYNGYICGDICIKKFRHNTYTEAKIDIFMVNS